MGTRDQRTARRFQVEALETRWTPSGLSGGVVLPPPQGGSPGGVLGDAVPGIDQGTPQGGASGGVLGDAVPGFRVDDPGGRPGGVIAF